MEPSRPQNALSREEIQELIENFDLINAQPSHETRGQCHPVTILYVFHPLGMHPSKRSRASPTGLTPTQRLKKRVPHSTGSARRRRLFEQPSASTSGSTEAVGITDSEGVSLRAIEVVKNPTHSHLYLIKWMVSYWNTNTVHAVERWYLVIDQKNEILGRCSYVPQE